MNKLIDIKEEHLNDSRIINILQLIRETSSADLSIEFLSSKIFMSPSRLRTLFKNCVGFPLHQYILRYKILTAITEMVNGHTIQDSVYYAGFNDSSHFNKMLTKIFNVKPSQFIKENLFNRASIETNFIFKTELR